MVLRRLFSGWLVALAALARALARRLDHIVAEPSVAGGPLAHPGANLTADPILAALAERYPGAPPHWLARVAGHTTRWTEGDTMPALAGQDLEDRVFEDRNVGEHGPTDRSPRGEIETPGEVAAGSMADAARAGLGREAAVREGLDSADDGDGGIVVRPPSPRPDVRPAVARPTVRSAAAPSMADLRDRTSEVWRPQPAPARRPRPVFAPIDRPSAAVSPPRADLAPVGPQIQPRPRPDTRPAEPPARTDRQALADPIIVPPTEIAEPPAPTLEARPASRREAEPAPSPALVRAARDPVLAPADLVAVPRAIPDPPVETPPRLRRPASMVPEAAFSAIVREEIGAPPVRRPARPRLFKAWAGFGAKASAAVAASGQPLTDLSKPSARGAREHQEAIEVQSPTVRRPALEAPVSRVGQQATVGVEAAIPSRSDRGGFPSFPEPAERRAASFERVEPPVAPWGQDAPRDTAPVTARRAAAPLALARIAETSRWPALPESRPSPPPFAEVPPPRLDQLSRDQEGGRWIV